MASVHSLLSVCQTTPRDVAEPAQARIALWDKWLAPVTPDNPAGDDAGYDDDFQQMREEVNKLSGADAGIVSQLAEKLLTTRTKDIRVATWYIWAVCGRMVKKDWLTVWSCWPVCCSVLESTCIHNGHGPGRRRWSGYAVPAYWTVCLCIRKW